MVLISICIPFIEFFIFYTIDGQILIISAVSNRHIHFSVIQQETKLSYLAFATFTYEFARF